MTITAPSSGTSVVEGTATTFSATASDAEDGDLASSVQWRSNVDGVLGTGGSLTVTLSPGTHTVTATVTDSDGNAVDPGPSVTVAVTYEDGGLLVRWIGEPGALWSNGSSWDSGTRPSDDDRAVIRGDSAHVIIIGLPSVKSLVLGNGSEGVLLVIDDGLLWVDSLTISGGAELRNSNGQLLLAGAGAASTIEEGGTLTIDGLFEIAPDHTLTNVGDITWQSGTVTLFEQARLDNRGIIEGPMAEATLGLEGSAILHNQVQGELVLHRPLSVSSPEDGDVIVNDGALMFGLYSDALFGSILLPDGAIELGGTVMVAGLEGYAPTSGTAFEVISSASGGIQGTFDAWSADWSITTSTATQVVLTRQ